MRDAAIVKIHFRDTLLRCHDIVHAVRKNIFALQFRFQHRLGEHRLRMIEDATKEIMHEARVNAPAEPARQNFFAVVFKVRTLVEKPVGDEKFWISFFRCEATPDFRHDQTNIVIHA